MRVMFRTTVILFCALVVLFIVLGLTACQSEEVKPSTPPSGVTKTEDIPFRSCEDAKDAGETPLHRGDPGYSRRLDADGDGTACE